MNTSSHLSSEAIKNHAFEKTGRLVTEENQNVLTEADLAEWEAAIDEYEERFGL